MRFIRRNGRTIPIHEKGAMSHGDAAKMSKLRKDLKSSVKTYNKHFGATDPINFKGSKENLFEAMKKKKGFIPYAAQRVSRSVKESSLKGLRRVGRGHAGIGGLALLGAGTATYGAIKAIKKYRNRDQ